MALILLTNKSYIRIFFHSFLSLTISLNVKPVNENTFKKKKEHTEESNVNSESFLHFIYDSVVSWTSSLQANILK